jgi:hypothetical protein
MLRVHLVTKMLNSLAIKHYYNFNGTHTVYCIYNCFLHLIFEYEYCPLGLNFPPWGKQHTWGGGGGGNLIPFTWTDHHVYIERSHCLKTGSGKIITYSVNA